MLNKMRQQISRGHETLRGSLHGAFPLHNIYEEISYATIMKDAEKRFSIPLDGVLHVQARRLFADFYDQTLRVVWEYQGQQHYRMSTRPGKNNVGAMEFAWAEQQHRDRAKRQICDHIGFRLIAVSYKDLSVISEEYVRGRLDEV